jgi:hypothetical protein
MRDAGRIEIHGFLDAAQAEGLGKEGVVGLCAGGEGGNVMKAFDLIESHGASPLALVDT